MVCKVLVCGGRGYNNRRELNHVLTRFSSKEKIRTIISGAANGADTFAAEWAKMKHVKVKEYPPDWKKYGRAAGPIRNAAMLREKPDYVIAFPGGLGTKNLKEQAFLAGIPVWEVDDSYAA